MKRKELANSTSAKHVELPGDVIDHESPRSASVIATCDGSELTW